MNAALLSRQGLWIPFGFLGIFLTTVCLRPLLPIDETRYLSVAWEMFLRHDWLAPLTKNGEPYHHKPPLLFWMINAVWAVTGPSRWAATMPPVAMGLASVYLTTLLAQRLFTRSAQIACRVPCIIMGCLPFLVYSSMVMFDVTMAFFVLLTILNMLAFAQTQRWRYVALMALSMGLGVLTKGPVNYLYVIFPMLLGPVWHCNALKPLRWYGGCLAALMLSIVPVLLWLLPVLRQSDAHFAFWLVWEQTAGRVTGGFKDAHVRPFLFYVPVAIVLAMPWAFFPQFWRQGRALRRLAGNEAGLRFVLCWLASAFVAFSLISGKQPHYLVPLIPGLAILIACLLEGLKVKTLRKVAMGSYAVFVLAHVIGSQTFFKNYDLMPVARYVRQNADRDWAFVKQYHGEVTFLARRQTPLDVLSDGHEAREWLIQHPEGLVIMRYEDNEDVAAFHEILSIPYRGKMLGIFKDKSATGRQ
ncbi:MAG: glycosyltransferase family 39 protein [Micavibrio aeruginosavorus]|uniref:Glycosyltransferase family 39 protein n=1 Tax=Micavibrio aeruginosavorus TaxID=349221 RepID=A0A7T5R3L5_9BACT|nr:MAG: glycosyltransferase family 39 protein [Micavibrio aeruginosavorus]